LLAIVSAVEVVVMAVVAVAVVAVAVGPAVFHMYTTHAAAAVKLYAR
jgi:hypothetical protein